NVSVTLTGSAASGFSGTGTGLDGVSAVCTVRAGSGTALPLTGLATGTWNLAATQTYASGAGTLSFSYFKSLNGGSGVDTFNVLVNTTADLLGNNGNDTFDLANGVALTGPAPGCTGYNNLHLSAYTTHTSLSLTNSAA